jgi:hypothetical protein
MLTWLQQMGKKRRRPAGAADNGHGTGGGELLPKAITALVVLLVRPGCQACCARSDLVMSQAAR